MHVDQLLLDDERLARQRDAARNHLVSRHTRISDDAGVTVGRGVVARFARQPRAALPFRKLRCFVEQLLDPGPALGGHAHDCDLRRKAQAASSDYRGCITP
jgi:hypothetical protein